MVKVKFCGMTNLDDCVAAADLGVDFVGFVFYRQSARYVTPAEVCRITQMLKGRIGTVGVFVEEKAAEIDALLDLCSLDFAQVYNAPQEVASTAILKRRISVCPVSDSIPPSIPSGLVLFDSLSSTIGGSGLPFEVEILKGHPVLKRAFVAGGIHAGNVGKALDLKPFGVDLVTGIEREKGRKDWHKMVHFMKTVRSHTP